MQNTPINLIFSLLLVLTKILAIWKDFIGSRVYSDSFSILVDAILLCRMGV